MPPGKVVAADDLPLELLYPQGRNLYTVFTAIVVDCRSSAAEPLPKV
jgi:hypothetical protein